MTVTHRNIFTDFQSFGDPGQNSFYASNIEQSPVGYSKSYMEPSAQQNYPNIFTPSESFTDQTATEFDEPPLLEELEIYPDRIIEKTLAVLNPFHSKSLVDDADFLTQDTDLAGPVLFCLALAVCLFVSGSSTPFGYIYGLSMISCFVMYCLLSLMTINSSMFTLTSVASILGYCLLPTVALACLRIFVSLYSTVGLCLAVLVVFWSSLSASRLFSTISGDDQQRPLIAYPCALVYGVFSLLIVF